MAYLGIGRTYDFLMAANQIMGQHGIELPLALQATTDGPALRRNINRWLADHCFGDCYTRNGLNDQEREMKYQGQWGINNLLRYKIEGTESS